MIAESRYDKTDRNSILGHALLLLGKSISELYPNIGTHSGKGSLGQIVEEKHFDYHPNSLSQPDFPEAGVELKCTPMKTLSNGNTVSKERLVLNIINYEKEGSTSFETSSFWQKNKFLLLMFYLYEQGLKPEEMFFSIIRYWDFPQEDLKIIIDDWNIIIKKIRDGKADTLSEGDTLFLGACMKGSAAGAELRKQFVKNAPEAQQRAYSLKSIYLNHIIVDSILNSTVINVSLDKKKKFEIIRKCEKIREESSNAIKSINEYKEGETFEDAIINKFVPYYNKSISEIQAMIGRNILLSAKDFAYSVARLILDVKTKKIAEFEKAGVILKTIQLENNGRLKESMSFKNINYLEIIKENVWEDSYWYSVISSRFLFVVFQKGENKNPILKKVFFWGMPVSDYVESQRYWNDTRNKIVDGDFSHFLKSTENNISHVRPKGKNSNDLTEDANGTMQRKYCYWFNRRYILSILENNGIFTE